MRALCTFFTKSPVQPLHGFTVDAKPPDMMPDASPVTLMVVCPLDRRMSPAARFASLVRYLPSVYRWNPAETSTASWFPVYMAMFTFFSLSIPRT